MSIDEIYERLGLEDPILYMMQRMGYAASNRHEEINRRTGKSTRIQCLAIRDLIHGKDVLVRCANTDQANLMIRGIASKWDELYLPLKLWRQYPSRILLTATGGALHVTSHSSEELGIRADRVYSDELSYRLLNTGESLIPNELFIRSSK